MSTAFQDIIDELQSGLTFQQINTYINLSSLILLCYDWMLNFSSEISLVWQSRWNLFKVLYLVTRYLACVDVTNLVFNMSAKTCSIIFAVFGWTFTTGFVLGELLLVMRTWAVWARDYKLGIALFIFYIGLVVPIYTNMAFFLKSLTFVDSLPGIRGCMLTGSSDRLYINWILLMILDLGVCLLMVVKGYRALTFGRNSQLLQVIFGQGILYYIYLVCLSMLNLILVLRLPREHIALLASPMRSLHSILTCRVVLHTRQQVKITTVVLGESTLQGTGNLSAPAEALRFAEVELETVP